MGACTVPAFSLDEGAASTSHQLRGIALAYLWCEGIIKVRGRWNDATGQHSDYSLPGDMDDMLNVFIRQGILG